MINILSTIATIMSVGGNFLLAKQNKLVFPIWIISNFLWVGIILATSMNIPQILMYVVYIGTSVYSWYSWNKEDKKKNS